MIYKQPTPVVGMGVTRGAGSDAYPYTVVEILGPRRIVVQADDYRRTDDRGPFTEQQDYEYTPNPDGHRLTLSLRKDGAWKQMRSSQIYWLGNRRAYRDPSF